MDEIKYYKTSDFAVKHTLYARHFISTNECQLWQYSGTPDKNHWGVMRDYDHWVKWIRSPELIEISKLEVLITLGPKAIDGTI